MFPIRHRLALIAAAGALAGISAPPAHGVIQYATDQRNLEPDPASIGYTAWNLQGYFSSWLATPIGPNHIVTAKHALGPLGSGNSMPFFFRGVQYDTDPTFNGTGYAADPNSDLVVFRVTQTLPAWATLYTSNDEGNKHVVTVGRGVPRGEAVIVNGSQKGWRWNLAGHDGAISWGENELTGQNVGGGAGIGDLLTFDFAAAAGQSTLAANDSGGGTFVQHNGQWKLAGINYATDGYKFSPTDAGLINAAIYDGSGLYYSNGSAASGPSLSYVTRVSSNLDFLYRFVEAPAVTLSNYTVNGRDDVGDVDVAGAVTLGPLARLKAYHIRSDSLSVPNNGIVTIKPNGGDRGVSKISTLLLNGNAKLDLNDNDLIVQATAATHAATLAEVVNDIKTARNHANAWQGPGIGSTAAHNDPTGKMILGVAPNRNSAGGALYDTWGGLDVDENSVLVKYTVAGDLTLDGVINIADYLRIDRAVATGATGYWNGDTNFDGRIDGADYFTIDMNYLDQFAGAPGGAIAANLGAVPEPGSAAVLALAALGLLRRRR